jgi:hypothetical protein
MHNYFIKVYITIFSLCNLECRLHKKTFVIHIFMR